MIIRFLAKIMTLMLISTALLCSCSDNNQSISDYEASQAVVILRGLPTLNTQHSINIVELDPEAKNFGEILDELAMTYQGEPLHHLYYSPSGRLYATGLDPKCSLAEINLARNIQGKPQLKTMQCLNTGGQLIGEDIIWTQSKNKEYMFVTFMGGTDLQQEDAGSVGVFDPNTNQLVNIIEARKSQVPKGAPYIMYPHGISAYKDRLVVSSTFHPAMEGKIGNSISIIDLNTLQPIQTINIEKAKPVNLPSSTVEVLFVRPDISTKAKPSLLVNTLFGYETWTIPFDETTKTFGKPEVIYDGEANNTGIPLEFYANDNELFVTHAIPGIVKRYHLDSLPKLISSGPDLIADPGSHHLMFFTSKSGKQYIAVQNNLGNMGDVKDDDPTDVDFYTKINAHTITIHLLSTGEKVATIDFKKKYNKGVEYVDALFGSGYSHHH